MDVVSDVLSRLPVRGTVTGECELHAPWGFVIPERADASFHIIAEGRCNLIHNDDLFDLNAGDLIVIPQGSTHSLMDRPDRDPVLLDALVRSESTVSSRGCRRYVGGANGMTTTIFCGHFSFAPGAHHLRNHLPELIHLRTSEDPTIEWLQRSLRLISSEARSAEPGAQIAVDRLVDLLFVQVLRAWLRPLSAKERPGWLAALADDKIGESLRRIHDDPAKAWTVDGLARAVGMSRSGFAARFAQLVGEPPLRYLMSWRMTLAAEHLQSNPSLSVTEIAQRVGYSSDAAFSNVFKRYYDAPPGSWRRSRV